MERVEVKFNEQTVVCEGCGKCCCGLRVRVRPADPVPPYLTRFAPTWPGSRVGVYFMQQQKGRCVALDENNRCSIYENRPQICRDFEAGCESCLELLMKHEKQSVS